MSDFTSGEGKLLTIVGTLSDIEERDGAKGKYFRVVFDDVLQTYEGDDNPVERNTWSAIFTPKTFGWRKFRNAINDLAGVSETPDAYGIKFVIEVEYFKATNGKTYENYLPVKVIGDKPQDVIVYTKDEVKALLVGKTPLDGMKLSSDARIGDYRAIVGVKPKVLEVFGLTVVDGKYTG